MELIVVGLILLLGLLTLPFKLVGRSFRRIFRTAEKVATPHLAPAPPVDQTRYVTLGDYVQRRVQDLFEEAIDLELNRTRVELSDTHRSLAQDYAQTRTRKTVKAKADPPPPPVDGSS